MCTQNQFQHKTIIERTSLVAMLVIMCTAGGCAKVQEKVSEVQEMIRKMRGLQPAPPPPLPPPTQAAPPTPGASAPAEAARPPIPTRRRALSVHADCSSGEGTGYVESIKLAVEAGPVDLLEVKIDIPRRGSCQFRLADFRQTLAAPHVELHSNSDSACTVRMGEQGDRFTVAFSSCQEKCTRGAFDYVWPVELNAKKGTCL